MVGAGERVVEFPYRPERIRVHCQSNLATVGLGVR